MTTSIPFEEYEYLLERENMLSALEAAGVDNWVGYDYAISEFLGLEEA